MPVLKKDSLKLYEGQKQVSVILISARKKYALFCSKNKAMVAGWHLNESTESGVQTQLFAISLANNAFKLEIYILAESPCSQADLIESCSPSHPIYPKARHHIAMTQSAATKKATTP